MFPFVSAFPEAASPSPPAAVTIVRRLAPPSPTPGSSLGEQAGAWWSGEDGRALEPLLSSRKRRVKDEEDTVGAAE